MISCFHVNDRLPRVQRPLWGHGFLPYQILLVCPICNIQCSNPPKSIRVVMTPYNSVTVYIWAGITQSVQRRAAGWTAGVWFPAGARDFSLPAASRLALGPSSLLSNEAGAWSWPLAPCNAEAKNAGNILPLPHTSLWSNASLIKHRDTSPLLFTSA
jgi:hypothetical protein